MANAACGYPAPRTDDTGVLLVAATVTSIDNAGSTYGPLIIEAELNGMLTSCSA